MDINEMQNLWGNQRQRDSFEFDEKALISLIKRKSKAAEKGISRVEQWLMGINTIVATLVLIDYFKDGMNDPWDLFLSFGMYGTVLFLYVFKIKRKTKNEQFDRSMIGELDYAIANTDAILRVSRLMITAYFLPVFLFVVAKMAYFSAPLSKWAVILGGFVLAYSIVIFERKKMHQPNRKRLEKLREQLTTDI